MKNILILFLLLCGSGPGFSQCAVNAGSSRFGIVSSDDVQYAEEIGDMVDKISDIFDLDCNYYFYNDAGAPNAAALKDDGNIYLGVNFMRQSFQRGAGLTGVYFIVAHELSHLWQFENPDNYLGNIDGTVRYSELQADFMAGYVLARLGVLNNYNYKQLLMQVWSMGDNNWRNPTTHGTPTERIMDTHLGITNSNRLVDAAYEASLSLAPSQNRKVEYVAEITLSNGGRLFILYGGAVFNVNNQQVGQMSGIPNTYNWRINFTTLGVNDIIISSNYVYSLQGQRIGSYHEY